MLMSQRDATQEDANIAAREKGLMAAREFQRVVQTFHKVLDYKEKYGKELEENLEELAKNLQENLNNLQVLNRNIEIYEQNSEKVLLNLNHLERKEKKYIEQYERLLRGVGLEAGSADPVDQGDEESSSHRRSREDLMNRRQGFLQHLDQNFKNLEEEMLNLETLKKELGETRSEIARRKSEALLKREELEEKGKKLLKEVAALEKELETSIQEEKILIDEFVKIISQAESCLEFGEKTDRILFSTLAALQSPDNHSSQL